MVEINLGLCNIQENSVFSSIQFIHLIVITKSKILRDGKEMASCCPGGAFATPCHPTATGLSQTLNWTSMIIQFNSTFIDHSDAQGSAFAKKKQAKFSDFHTQKQAVPLVCGPFKLWVCECGLSTKSLPTPVLVVSVFQLFRPSIYRLLIKCFLIQTCICFYAYIWTRLEGLFSARGRCFPPSNLRAWKGRPRISSHMKWFIF